MERTGVAAAGVIAALAFAAADAVAANGPALAVDASADRHAISPDIYGLNFADPGLASELGLPVDRWGGNTTDAYNWQLHAANTGNDWFFENTADCWDSAHNWCSGGPANGYAEFVEKDQAAGAKSLITLPTMGYVAKDAPLDHPLTCGFPETVFASQNAFDPYDANCGNGMNGGSELASDPTRDGMPIDPSFDAAWVQDLKARGVSLYELGNEPALWSDTHRDMHPAAETYDELWQKTRDYAIAVKGADPAAKVLGFSEWGWPNYFDSAAGGADRAAHGGTPLVEWLLQQLHAYDQTHGQRLVDYLDLHYYRQGGSTTDVTRSLWDPTYTDPSWINDQIRLLPRMHAWVDADYPGTKLALSEYNLSVSGDAVANALIQADVLGIFAREGLDLATRWPVSDDGNLIPDAFRMFRNYDGGHHRFGDTWVHSSSGDQGQLAVYGAQRASDGALTLLMINKTANPLTSPVSLAGANVAGPAQTWQWTGGAISRVADQPISSGGFTATYPARSLTLFVVPTDAGGSGGSGGNTGNTGPPGNTGTETPTGATTGGSGPGGQVPVASPAEAAPPVAQPAPTATPPAFAVERLSAPTGTGAIAVIARVGAPGTLSAVATATTPRRRRAAATLAYGSAAAVASGAGTVTATVRPSRAARARLRAHQTLRVNLSIAFAPRDGAPPAPQTRSLRVRLPKRR